MALTATQLATLNSLKKDVDAWKIEQLALIDDEFLFLNSIKLSDSLLSGPVVTKVVENAESIINSLQLTGALSENP